MALFQILFQPFLPFSFLKKLNYFTQHKNFCRKDADPTHNDSEMESLNRLKSIEGGVIQIQSRSMSDPSLSDIDIKNL